MDPRVSNHPGFSGLILALVEAINFTSESGARDDGVSRFRSAWPTRDSVEMPGRPGSGTTSRLGDGDGPNHGKLTRNGHVAEVAAMAR